MVMLRRTQKLSSALPVTSSGRSDTALGDWYVNRVVVDRQPLLLILSSASLLPILVPARDVKSLPDRLGEIVCERLVRLGIPAPIIAAERRVMNPVCVGPTADRSVVGVMVDFAKVLPHYFRQGASHPASLAGSEAHLEGTPCYAGKAGKDVVRPDTRTRELLAAKWQV